MTPISYIVSRTGTINAVVNGKSYVVPRTHRNYDLAKATLADQDGDKFIEAVDYEEVIRRFVPPSPARRVEVRDGNVWYNGVILNNVVTERILALSADGFPFGPVANFLDNVEQNPSYRAVQELYKFLEHRALPLTDNGCFLGYKAVRPDWKDKHSGTFDNSIGQVVRVPRNTVDDDFRRDCSHGLHVGSIEYVNGFKAEGDHVVIVRVNPRDVVSVPSENNCTKLRTCEYEVIGEYTGDLTGLVYTSQGDAVPPPSRNDPAQGVTLAPPPRTPYGWGGVDLATPGQDTTAVVTYDPNTNTLSTQLKDFTPIRPGDVVTVGGVEIEVDADQAKNDADKAFAFEADAVDPEDDDDDSDSELEEFSDSDLDGSDLDDSDPDDKDEDSDLEDNPLGLDDDYSDDHALEATSDDVIPLAEAAPDDADVEAEARYNGVG